MVVALSAHPAVVVMRLPRRMAKALAVAVHAALRAKHWHRVTTRKPCRLKPATMVLMPLVANAPSKMVKTAAAGKATTVHASAPHATTHAAPMRKPKARHLAQHVSPANRVSLAPHASTVSLSMAAKATTALTTNPHARMRTWAHKQATRYHVHLAAMLVVNLTPPAPALI